MKLLLSSILKARVEIDNILFFDYFVCGCFELSVVVPLTDSSLQHRTLCTVHLKCLFRKPLHIPSTNSFYIPHHQFKSVKIQRCYRVESDIEDDQRPFKEGILGVS